jgi:hypothetical protein
LDLLSTFVPLLGAAAGIGYVSLAVRRRQQAIQAPVTVSDPELERRVRALCAAVGYAQVPVLAVSAGGRPMLRVRDGSLLISPQMGALLSDEELTALVTQELAAPLRSTWKEMLRAAWPLLVVLCLLIIPSVLTGKPFYMLILLIAAVWFAIAAQQGQLTARVARESFTVFLERGGDPAAYLSATAKVYADIAGRADPRVRTQLYGTMRAYLKMAAEMGCVAPGQLAELAAAAQAPVGLYAPERLPLRQRMAPYRFLFMVVGWVLLLGLSVLVAMSLNP